MKAIAVDNVPVDNFWNDIAKNLLIGALAGIVRLAYSREGGWKVDFITFGGGLAFGILVGQLVRPVPWLHAYNDGIVALCALLGKEIVNVLRRKLPTILIKTLQTWLPEKPEDKKEDKKDDGDSVQ